MRRRVGHVLPVLALLLSGVLWGVISIFIRKLSSAGLSTMQICFIRLVFAAPIFVVAALIFSPKHMRIRLRDIWIFIGTGVISIFLFNYFYFYTIIHSEASVAVVLLYTSPIFVMILSVILFKEKIGPTKIIALVMTFIGCVLVSGVITGTSVLRPIVGFIGVLSGLFYALYTIFGVFGLKRYDPITVTAYTFLFALIVALPVGDVKGTFTVIGNNPTLWLWCAGISVVGTVLPYFFYTWGLKYVESSRASLLSAVEPLVASLVGIVFYGEGRNFAKILGIVFVLAALLLLNLRKPKQKEQGSVCVTDSEQCDRVPEPVCDCAPEQDGKCVPEPHEKTPSSSL